jgi:hypothetical protein
MLRKIRGKLCIDASSASYEIDSRRVTMCCVTTKTGGGSDVAHKPIGTKPLTVAERVRRWRERNPAPRRLLSTNMTDAEVRHVLSTWTTGQLKRALRQITAEALKRGVK